jgi:hypothetical protein
MAFFDFKITSLQIGKNYDIGKAEIQIFSFVTNSNFNTFLFDRIIQEKDENKQKELLKTAANEVLSFKEFLKIDHVKKNSTMNFGANGYSLFRSDKIPEYFDYTICLMEDDSKVREFGKFLDNLVNHSSFDKFSTNVLKLVMTTATPQIVIAAELTKFIAKVVAGQLLVNKDEQVGLFMESLNLHENYSTSLYVGKDIPDLANNCKISYSIFKKD